MADTMRTDAKCDLMYPEHDSLLFTNVVRAGQEYEAIYYSSFWSFSKLDDIDMATDNNITASALFTNVQGIDGYSYTLAEAAIA